MPSTPNDYAQQIRRTLAIADPDLDTTVGSVARKIIDAVAESMAEINVDKYLLDYQYDIESKVGADLDDFVALFGITRIGARRATGTVTFERGAAADTNLLIPVGTQLATGDTNPVIVSTVVPAMITQGATTVDVPVQSVIGGARGNVAANTVTRRVTPITGVMGFTNGAALIGGTDAENDEQLRFRFRRTVFRNLAGTEQMFLGIALDDPDVTQANVIGATKRRRERVQLVAGTATSIVPDAKFVYTDSVVFGRNIDSGDIFIPSVNYTFSNATPPVVTSIDGVNVPDGIYDLEYEYVPTSSRNDPTNGVTNRVDIYVNGNRPIEASEVTIFRTSRVFNTTAGDPLNRASFRRIDNSQPVAGNYLVALAFSPVTDPAVNNTIVIGANSYVEGTDFFLVNDITAAGGTPESLSGIEWVSVANGATKPVPANLTSMSIDYIYNSIPRDVEAVARAWRLVTTDVRVHAARPMLLNLYLAVIFQPGYVAASVQAEMQNALGNFIAGIGFNGVVQVSDLLEVAHRVPGVDAVRFLTSTDDGTHYSIQQVSGAGTIISTYATAGRAIDVIVGDDQVPVLNSVTLVAKAQNTFGSV